MKYTIILKNSGERFKWDDWVAKPPQERTRLIVQNGGAKAELEKNNTEKCE